MEEDMPIPQVLPNETESREEQAIVSAVTKYFDTAPKMPKSSEKNAESQIFNAFHRYFATK